MKVYRGYNKDYPNWGMREGQNHIWTTDDLDYAIMYANIFDNGGLVEFEIDDNMINVANEYDYENILGDDFGGDPIDADNTTCQIIKNEGYNVIHFESGDNDIFLILDKSLIKSAREIDLNNDIDNQINEVLKLAGVTFKHNNIRKIVIESSHQLNDDIHNMTWEEFVEKVGRENEFDGSVVISKHNTSIIIRQSGRILVRKLGKKPFMKAYSNLKTFDEIYNMLVEKGFVEEQILTEAVNQHSLYHGCDLAYAVSMMIDNAMRGETIANINGKKYQGNSLTRSLQFAKDWQEDRWDGYGDELNKFWVVLELNKERLKTKYKVLPYNYWEEYFGQDYEHTIDRNGYGDQYEEFVVGRINNLRNYLDDVYLSDECLYVEYAEIFAIVKRELELRGEDCSDSDIDKALQVLGIDKPSPDDFDSEKLNENYDGMPMVYPNPTYSEFHDIMRRFTTTGTLSAIIDGDDIYCWDSYYIHHGTMIRYIENKMGIKISDNAICVRFREPNIVWVSAAYFDDYDDDELEDLETQDFEKELKYNPVIRKYFPKGAKIVRFNRKDEPIVYDDESNTLNEEIAFGKMVNDKMVTILKNPTRNELKKNGINYARIVVDDYGNIYFGPAKRYSHAMIVHELEKNNISEFDILGPGYDWGFDVFLYDQTTNTFYYRVDYMSEEEEKEKLENAKDFLNRDYFKKSFGDFNVQTTDEEEPWEK